MSDILFEVKKGKGGDLGVITLNRVNALNALTLEMIQQLHQQLNEWDSAENIKAIIAKSNCEKAFCAGGDIKSIYHHWQTDMPKQFFEKEYACDAKINQLSKAFISFLDGITMGGGAGICMNGHFRIASDKLVFAMPETKIGFFPDVGAASFLNYLPGNIGLYLALTGNSIHLADAYELGIASIAAARDTFEMIETQLLNEPFDYNEFNIIGDILDHHDKHPGSAALDEQRDIIKQCFSHNSVEAILNALAEANTDFSRKTIAQLHERSPTSLKVTLQHFDYYKDNDAIDVLRSDYYLAEQFLNCHDFHEGIRATVIDKDKKPQWQPATLDSVTPDMVKQFFEE